MAWHDAPLRSYHYASLYYSKMVSLCSYMRYWRRPMCIDSVWRGRCWVCWRHTRGRSQLQIQSLTQAEEEVPQALAEADAVVAAAPPVPVVALQGSISIQVSGEWRERCKTRKSWNGSCPSTTRSPSSCPSPSRSPSIGQFHWTSHTQFPLEEDIMAAAVAVVISRAMSSSSMAAMLAMDAGDNWWGMSLAN